MVAEAAGLRRQQALHFTSFVATNLPSFGRVPLGVANEVVRPQPICVTVDPNISNRMHQYITAIDHWLQGLVSVAARACWLCESRRLEHFFDGLEARAEHHLVIADFDHAMIDEDIHRADRSLLDPRKAFDAATTPAVKIVGGFLVGIHQR